ncbi:MULTISPECIES: ATP-binding protein [unclassified Nonomuraea]|uniref:ATP-binding protein n=1 Tax=unclassified Nonomuraea TaxID=2593643 RepID=UPI003401BE07
MNPRKPIIATSATGLMQAYTRLKALVCHIDTPLDVPGVDMATWPLPPGRSCVRRARRLTRAQLTDWHVNRHSKSADLLVSALVARAYRHGRGPIRLTLWTMDGTLRCEVEHADPALPHTGHTGQDDEQGHWLSLIDQFACCWGATPTAAGKAVWFELPESPRAADELTRRFGADQHRGVSVSNPRA